MAVAVKCTFDIRPDGSTKYRRLSLQSYARLSITVRRAEQPKVRVRPSSHEDHNDVLSGWARVCSGGQPVTQMQVGFRVGSIRKYFRLPESSLAIERSIIA